jgi:D-alanyl-D-alanine carboxypeptidase/D-alanyl-D-alanine-endopeptidase (penicillin-binding protein 4)
MTDQRTTDDDGSEAGAGESAVDRALRGLVPRGASAAVLAVRAADGAVVATMDADRTVMPASNTKLFTAALALEHLGADHRFETTISARGALEDRALDGALVLRGTGAPDLERADLRTLADAVADRLDRVDGDLLLDASRFEGPHLGPGRVWTDARHAYGAPSSALALAGNVVDVSVRTEDGVSATIDPATDAVVVDVDAVFDPEAASSGDDGDLEVHTDPHSGRIRVEGRLPPDDATTVEVPVANPVRHCGLAAREALSGAGIDLAGTVRVDDVTCEFDQQLAAVESAPVADIVRLMDVDSDNVVADNLARAVAAAAATDGSWAAWEALVDDLMSSLGVETTRIRDGSGLSRYNLASARGVVTLLTWAADRPWADVFFGSLPGPGEGTLADRLQGVPVVAKTGTLTGARALSGRIGDGDDAVLFAVLVGGLADEEETVRDRQDDLVRALAASFAPTT